MKTQLDSSIENLRNFLGINKDFNTNKKLQISHVLKTTTNKSRNLKYPEKTKKQSINILANECSE